LAESLLEEQHMERPPETETIAFDPFADHTEVPYDLFASLRETCPVSRTPLGPFFVTRYDDVVAGFRDWRAFPSAGGMRLPGFDVPEEERILSELDGARHQRRRKLMMSALAPPTIRAAEPYIERISKELIGSVLEKGRADLVSEFTGPLPGSVIAHLIGIPVEDQDRFRQWSDDVIADHEFITTNRNARGVGLKAAHPEFADYIDEQVAVRRSMENPPDDFVTRAMNAEEDGDRLNQTEIRATIFHLIVAGHETTTNLLGNMLFELIRRPELLAAVRDDRSLVPAAIEESLRHDSPAQMMVRDCARPAGISGTDINAGDKIILSIASANRDERVYEDPDSFRLDRNENADHLAFGYGRHICLGAALARLEGVVALNVFLDMVEQVEFAPGFVYEKNPAFWVLGPRRLDVILRGRA
jgi:cytochrome P450